MTVDGFHAIKSIELTVPTAHKHVIARFRFHIHCELHCLRSCSCWCIIQSNPRWRRVEIQSITGHPNSVASIKTGNRNRSVRINDFQTPRHIGHRIACVEVHRIAKRAHIIYVDRHIGRVITYGVVDPFFPSFNVDRVYNGGDISNDIFLTNQQAIRYTFQLSNGLLRIQPEIVRVLFQGIVQHPIGTNQLIVKWQLHPFWQRVLEIEVLVCR